MAKGSYAKKRGTRAEYAVRDTFRSLGWAVVRSGGSLGPVDLVCIKGGKLMLVQVKRNVGGSIYLGADVPESVQGFPITFVADFGRGNVRVVPKMRKITPRDGTPLEEYLAKRTSGNTK